MKRSKEDVIAKILDICIVPTGKTKVIYQANLNFCIAKAYLEMLINSGCLETIETNQTLYKTTEKGMKALQHLKAFRESLQPAGQLS